MSIGTLAVVGTGLIGTSVGLAARRKWPDVRLVEIDRGQQVGAARGADVVVLATPVDVIVRILHEEARSFGASLILDTGSSKRVVVGAARAAGLSNFVGGHPMAGAASSGPREARADMFDRRSWFLVPADAASGALTRARGFVEGLGATPVLLDDDGTEHDRVMAAVSHLPQVVASALMLIVGEAVGERGLAWAGPGLRDTTRLATSDASVWASVLATNRAELAPLLVTLADRLRGVAHTLDEPSEVRRLFDAAARYRARLEGE